MPRHHVILSMGGEQLTVEEYGDATESGAPLVFLPALGVPLAYYQPLLSTWSRSRRIFALEWRGTPNAAARTLRESAFGYSTLIRHDLPAVFALANSYGPPIVVGHSLGGQIAVLATAAGHVTPRAIVTIASGSSAAHRNGPRLARWQRAAQAAFVLFATRSFGYWPGDRFGFAGRQPGFLMRDWAHEARTGRYLLHGDPTDYESLLPALGSRTALVSIHGDRMIPAQAVDALAHRLPPTTTTRMHVVGGASDHFLWARRDPGRIVDPIEAWLRPD
ncbi:alpha/beta fold hydrolase [Microbacterium murale]|uniref:Alpha/beta hydrolase n=1 Tax=Microbacterium murale TaxID=1081040 RepID=A0ABU0PAI5_9MICO|nr:alpha/beta fold hydrolase [Microbacterium murale]MDQ0644348.1 putative alpha/beta hydrolase [Microbacterium murale]